MAEQSLVRRVLRLAGRLAGDEEPGHSRTLPRAALYGPGTSHDRRGSTAVDVLAARVPLVDGATGLYSWLHVEDAASAAVAALERGAPGIYNVVDDEPAAQSEWLPVLARALGAEPPAAADAPPPPYAPEMSMHGASNTKAKRELGWQPRYPSWREGFAASLQS
jgi:nucleoside-diphosphate-sugar epimerase